MPVLKPVSGLALCSKWSGYCRRLPETESKRYDSRLCLKVIRHYYLKTQRR